MARAYQDAHIIDNLTSSVKTLQSQTTELLKAKGLHEERLTNILRQNEQQVKKIDALETRASANEHNTPARITNAHLHHTRTLQHTPLTPLHDLGTNRPIQRFPKHERDIRTMGAAEVIQVLQALDVQILGMNAAEKKKELRAQVGLPRDVVDGSGVGGSGGGGSGSGGGGGKGENAVGFGKDGGAGVGLKKALPKVAPGSTAEKKG